MSDNLPGAWYDAGAHLDQAMSVLESVPDLVALQDSAGGYQHAGNLIGAAYSLLELLQQDIRRMELELSQRTVPVQTSPETVTG